MNEEKQSFLGVAGTILSVILIGVLTVGIVCVLLIEIKVCISIILTCISTIITNVLISFLGKKRSPSLIFHSSIYLFKWQSIPLIVILIVHYVGWNMSFLHWSLITFSFAGMALSLLRNRSRSYEIIKRKLPNQEDAMKLVNFHYTTFAHFALGYWWTMIIGYFFLVTKMEEFMLYPIIKGVAIGFGLVEMITGIQRVRLYYGSLDITEYLIIAPSFQKAALENILLSTLAFIVIFL